MFDDFPELLDALARGLALGVALSITILVCRWVRGRTIRPKRDPGPAPLSLWVMGTVMFSGMAILEAATGSYSFAIAFGLAAIPYAVAWVRRIRANTHRV